MNNFYSYFYDDFVAIGKEEKIVMRFGDLW